LFGIGGTASPAKAQIETSVGTFAPAVAVTSNYIFRGLSQTRKEPAAQASLEYTYGIGAFTPYLGTFISNTKFPSNNVPAGSTNIRQKVELDLYGGVRVETPLDGLTVDLGFIKYYYPNNTAENNKDGGPNTYGDPQWNEFYGKLAYNAGFATFVGSAFYTKDFSYGAGKGVYYEGGLDVPAPYGFTVSGRLGRQTIQRNFQFGVPDYTTWNIGIARDLEFLFGIAASLVYSDTNIKRNAALGVDGVAGGNVFVGSDTYETAKPQVSFTLTKKF
jgi:uncharacterized protein (TIGR02001 family)